MRTEKWNIRQYVKVGRQGSATEDGRQEVWWKNGESWVETARKQGTNFPSFCLCVPVFSSAAVVQGEEVAGDAAPHHPGWKAEISWWPDPSCVLCQGKQACSGLLCRVSLLQVCRVTVWISSYQCVVKTDARIQVPVSLVVLGSRTTSLSLDHVFPRIPVTLTPATKIRGKSRVCFQASFWHLLLLKL